MSELTLGVDEPAAKFVGPDWFDRAVCWLKDRERPVFAVAAGFHVLFLVTMIILQAVPYLVGETIYLKVVPVDPRDLFRGDYVVLSYDISRAPVGGIRGIPDSARQWHDWREEAWLEDRTVYVTLERDADGNHWHGVKASIDRPAGGKYIRGKYTPRGWGAPLRFGIEAYYVEEGTGRKFEDAARQKKLAAEIALTSWGQAKLKGLRIE